MNQMIKNRNSKIRIVLLVTALAIGLLVSGISLPNLNTAKWMGSIPVTASKKGTSAQKNSSANGNENIADHLVISEIYYNAGNEDGSEFFELYNPTSNEVNLEGWSFSVDEDQSIGFKEATKEEGAPTISAHGFLLIASEGWSQGKDDTDWPEADVLASLSLNNGGETIKIIDGSGVTVDSVTYAGDADDKQGVERKARSSSTADKMRDDDEGDSAVDANSGNGYDTDNFSQDFVGPLPGEPQNSSSTETLSGNVAGNEKPIAKTGGPYECEKGRSLQLDASESRDPDGEIASFEWDYDGDEEFDDDTGEKPSYSCEVTGSQELVLRVKDGDGATDTSATEIIVTEPGEVSGSDTVEITITSPGWNMVSIPLSPDEKSPSEVFQVTESTKVQRWNASKEEYSTKEEGFSLKAGKGHWIYLTAPQLPKTYEIEGNHQYYREIALKKKGWHQVGTPGDYGMNNFGVKKGENGKIFSAARAVEKGWIWRFVWKWDPEKRYHYAYEFGKNEVTLKAGNGFWVRTKESDVRLVIPYSSPPSPSSKISSGESGGIPLGVGNSSGGDVPKPPGPPKLLPTAKVVVNAYHNSGSEKVIFSVKKPEVDAIGVTVFSSAGSKIFSTGLRKGSVLRWDTSGLERPKLSNGIHFYVLEAKREKGGTVKSGGKFLLLK